MRRRFFERFLFRYSLFALGIGIFCLLAFGSTFFIVREIRISTEQIAEEESRMSAESMELAGFDSLFSDTNRSVSRALSFYRLHPSWTDVLLAVDRSVSDEVTLFSLSSKEYRVFLSGTARTRDDFLSFVERLREESCFSEVETPVSNLFSREDVEFQVDILVAKECLKPNF